LKIATFCLILIPNRHFFAQIIFYTIKLIGRFCQKISNLLKNSKNLLENRGFFKFLKIATKSPVATSKFLSPLRDQISPLWRYIATSGDAA